jgi:Flp pilus assembly protein TadD
VLFQTLQHQRSDFRPSALQEARKALDLDPLSPFYAGQLGLALVDRGDYDRATELFRKALEFDPNNLRAHFGLGEIYEARGDYERAITEFRTASELPRGRLDVVAQLAEVYVKVRRRADAGKLFAEVNALAAQRHVSPLDLASLCSAKRKRRSRSWKKPTRSALHFCSKYGHDALWKMFAPTRASPSWFWSWRYIKLQSS